MKSPRSDKTAILLSVSFVLLLGVAACDRAGTQPANTSSAKTAVPDKNIDQLQMGDKLTNKPEAAEARSANFAFEKVSLAEGEQVNETAAAIDRKIIRNADLTIEVPSTTDTQQKIVSIAETNGGFVVTSEAKQRDSQEPAQRTLDIKLVVRIPENHFGAALDQIRALASNVPEAKITGQDVTEEFIDLEARIKTQTALEQQFLQIMKQAHKVEDALEVQRQIADVRTEIEKLEGRKHFLENRSSLSTITINIITPRPMVVVPTTGFRHSVSEAISDSIDVGAAILLFFVRFAIVMIPVGVLVLLPSGLLLRYVIRRAKRIRLAQALSATPSQ
ncbi:MAG TPA: DUF4349 domain-containing protein [Pyrinomonadaceae bacterium]